MKKDLKNNKTKKKHFGIWKEKVKIVDNEICVCLCPLFLVKVCGIIPNNILVHFFNKIYCRPGIFPL